MNLDDFIENNKPSRKKTVFDEYINDITKLLNLGYSQKQIVDYLKSKCKNTTGLTQQNLSFYLRKSKNKTTPELNNINKEKLENVIKENSNKKPIDIFANLKR